MSAADYLLAIEAGANYRRVLRVSRQGIEPVERLDLTGWTPRLQMRPSAADIDVYLDCRPENGRVYTATDPDSGDVRCLVVIDLSDEDTRRLDFTAAVYDLIITDGTETRRLLQGAVTVSQDVTQ